MNAILAVLGFIILVTGHQSGWIFVGGLGFILGYIITDAFGLVRSPLESILYSLVTGLIGALLVTYFKRILVVLGAAFAGWYVCLYLPALVGLDTSWISLPVLAAVALICALATLFWGSLPLILISSVMGTTVIIQNVRFGGITNLVMLIILIMFGIIAQFVLWQYSLSEPE